MSTANDLAGPWRAAVAYMKQHTDPLLEERLSRIRSQVIAALALREVLGDMGFPLPHEFGLLPLIRLAKDHGIQSYREANILIDIND